MYRILLATVVALLLAACGPQGEAPAENTADGTSPEASSKCVLSPPAEAMACTMDWRPVCGCDGVTYSNACTANAAGVPSFDEGECSNSERLD